MTHALAPTKRLPWPSPTATLLALSTALTFPMSAQLGIVRFYPLGLTLCKWSGTYMYQTMVGRKQRNCCSAERENEMTSQAFIRFKGLSIHSHYRAEVYIYMPRFYFPIYWWEACGLSLLTVFLQRFFEALKCPLGIRRSPAPPMICCLQ